MTYVQKKQQTLEKAFERVKENLHSNQELRQTSQKLREQEEHERI